MKHNPFKLLAVMALTLTTALSTSAQNTGSATADNSDKPIPAHLRTDVCEMPESFPLFPGAKDDTESTRMVYKWFHNYIYTTKSVLAPPIAIELGYNYTVLDIIIEADGTVAKGAEPPLNKDGKPIYGSTKEIIRMVESMPKWEPAKNGDKPVAVKYNLRVPISLSYYSEGPKAWRMTY